MCPNLDEFIYHHPYVTYATLLRILENREDHYGVHLVLDFNVH